MNRRCRSPSSPRCKAQRQAQKEKDPPPRPPPPEKSLVSRTRTERGPGSHNGDQETRLGTLIDTTLEKGKHSKIVFNHPRLLPGELIAAGPSIIQRSINGGEPPDGNGQVRLKSRVRVSQFKAQARSKGRRREEDLGDFLNEEEERTLLNQVNYDFGNNGPTPEAETL